MIDCWCRSFDGLQDADGSINGRVKEVLLCVLNIEVELIVVNT